MVWSRFRLTLILSLVLAAGVPRFAYAPPEPGAPYTPDLSTPEGRAENLLSILLRHNNLMSGQIAFRRNLQELYAETYEVRNQLGSRARSLTVGPTESLTVEFVTSGVWRYDQAKLDAVTSGLAANLRRLGEEAQRIGLGDLSLTDLTADLRAIKERTEGAAFGRVLRLLIPVLPLFYDQQGKPRFQNLSQEFIQEAQTRIQQFGGPELDNLYLDLMKNHLSGPLNELAATRGFGAIGTELQRFENGFVNQQLRPALQPVVVADSGGKTKRILTLEEMPTAMTPIRGCLFDCSMGSVPQYGQGEGVRGYWIGKGNSVRGRPDGYVLVAETTVNGRRLPYIVTINGGTLTADETRQIMRLVAFHWNATEVLVPGTSAIGATVNYTPIRDGMGRHASTEVVATFPPSWNTLDGVARYQYYKAEVLKNARLVRVVDLPSGDSSPIRSNGSSMRYEPVSAEDVGKIPLLERAYLAAEMILQDANPTPEQTAAENRAIGRIQVSREQAALGFELKSAREISYTQFQRARELLGFTFKDLERMELPVVARTYAGLYRDARSLMTEDEWKAKFIELDGKINAKLADMDPTTYEFHRLYGGKLILPDELTGNMTRAKAILASGGTLARRTVVEGLEGIPLDRDLFLMVLDLLEDGDTAIIQRAAQSLAQQKATIPEFWQRIERLLSSSDATTRNQTVEVLRHGQFPMDPTFMSEGLVAFMRSSNPQIRRSAADILLSRTNWAPAVVLAAPRLLRDASPDVRLAMIEALSRYLSKGGAIGLDFWDTLRSPGFNVSEEEGIRRWLVFQYADNLSEQDWHQIGYLLDGKSDERTNLGALLKAHPNWPPGIRKKVYALSGGHLGWAFRRAIEETGNLDDTYLATFASDIKGLANQYSPDWRMSEIRNMLGRFAFWNAQVLQSLEEAITLGIKAIEDNKWGGEPKRSTETNLINTRIAKVREILDGEKGQMERQFIEGRADDIIRAIQEGPADRRRRYMKRFRLARTEVWDGVLHRMLESESAEVRRAAAGLLIGRPDAEDLIGKAIQNPDVTVRRLAAWALYQAPDSLSVKTMLAQYERADGAVGRQVRKRLQVEACLTAAQQTVQELLGRPITPRSRH